MTQDTPELPGPLEPWAAVEAILQLTGLPATALARLRLRGSEAALFSSFALGCAAQASFAALAFAAAERFWQRTSVMHEVEAGLRNAAVEFGQSAP